MSISVPAMVTPSLLIWAREEAGFALEVVAEKTKIPLNKLWDWEEGKKQPSIRQAEKLAKLYDRTLSVLSLPQPPELPPLATEYRHLPGINPGDEPPALRRFVRRLVQQRRIAIHLFEELSDEPLDFSFSLKIEDDSEKAGDQLRDALRVSIEQQMTWTSEFEAFRAWRTAVEKLGVLVCQFPGKEITEVRGLGILHFPLPVIGISSKEIPLAKPFTLVHELVHLALAVGNEEMVAFNEKRSSQEWLKIERFCESVAAVVLMPKQALIQDTDVIYQKATAEWTVNGMRRTAKRFKVTPTAVATRLLWLNVMSYSDYSNWKQDWKVWRESHPENSGFAIKSPPEKAITRAGPLFTSLVLDALNFERISSTDASQYLNISFNHVETLRKAWMQAPGPFPTKTLD